MKSTNYFAGVAVLVMISAGALSFQSTPAGVAKSSRHIKTASAQRPEASKLEVMNAYGKLPLSFEANQGQTDSQVKFLSHGSGYAVYLTPTEAVLSLPESGVSGESNADRLREIPKFTLPEKIVHGDRPLPSSKSTVLRMQFVGANPTTHVSGRDELPGKSNYFIGNDPTKWRTNVANYAKVEYKEIYPGVDLVYYGNQSQLEHDFILAPGANPSAITMEFKGADKLSIDSQGDLVCATPAGKVRLQKPVVFQEMDVARREIAGSYVLKGEHRIGFELGAYDTSRRLVIDPVLSYSTYLGGSVDDGGQGIAVDSSGNAYVTGGTASSNFPTVNPLPAPNNALQGQGNAFVSKLSFSDGTLSLAYSAYLGGNFIDTGQGIAVDSSGNAYVTGYTYSSNFPTVNPLPAPNNALQGTVNAFVSKLSFRDGALSLAYSTYLGGSIEERGAGIAVDASGNAYVTGYTGSSNFPTVNPLPTPNNALQGIYNAFVSKLSFSDGTLSLAYSTYLGGSVNDGGQGIAVDSSSNAYVTGYTASSNFPTVNPLPAPNNALQGQANAFVSKLSFRDGTLSLAYSTYLGGSVRDDGQGIAVDSSGNAYVAGSTLSSNFPMVNPLPAPNNVLHYKAFVSKLSFRGGTLSLAYSTSLGGSYEDYGQGVAVDSSGNAYVVGTALSSDFPTVNPLPAPNNALQGFDDAFVSKLSFRGKTLSLAYSTYLGGSVDEWGIGIAVDSSGNTYVTGFTYSNNFPMVNPLPAPNNALQAQRNAFVSKIGGETLSELINTVNSFNLPPGIANSLDVKLQAAQGSSEANNINAACNQLNAFIHEVMAQSYKKITMDQANQLIAQANTIITNLGCKCEIRSEKGRKSGTDWEFEPTNCSIGQTGDSNHRKPD